MRFMNMVIAKGNEAPGPPDAETMEKMMKYNEALRQAGVLLALEGLMPPSMGARVSASDGKTTVTDGPFSEVKEVLGGYWMLQVKSKAEAVEWARRAPMAANVVIEVRQVHDFEDFPTDVQDELKKKHAELHAHLGDSRKA